MKTFLLVAGEASGDLHGARVIREIAARVPGARFVGMGGPRMVEAGLEALYDANEINVMGFVEVLPKVARILTILGELGRFAERERPDAALLIDVPDFNLRLAQRLQELGIPVAYYIAPMAWAWRESRVRTLRQRVDELLCIYPFEEEFFRRRGVNANFVGNPLLEQERLRNPPQRAEARRRLGIDEEAKVAALLPGSRHSELQRVLPTLAEAGDLLVKEHGVRLVLPVAPTLDRAFVEAFFEGHEKPIFCDATADAVASCDAAAVCSGTATLETALLQRPLVVVYRATKSSAFLARRLIRLPHYCIVNLLAGREVVPEIFQEAFTPEATVQALLPLLQASPERDEMLASFGRIRGELGRGGATVRVADALLRLAEERSALLAPALAV